MDIESLISECTAYDYKEALEEKKPKSWLKSVSAFANGLGGSLFYGVDNDGLVKGLDDIQKVSEAISMKIRDYMDPLPNDDNAFTILANSFESRTSQSWDKKYLQSFGLVTKTGLLTNAGMLFADDCKLSQSRLYCTRWNGVEKGDAVNDAEFKGNILLLLREAMNFIKANTRKGWVKLPDGRMNKPEYAERAILEACVNHLIHRDYTVMGGEVHIDIYDNRLVFTSPGGMYSGQNVQDVPLEDVSSERRNPVLADVMAQLDYMEKRGSGLKRIIDETKGLDSYKEELKPLFKSSASQFMTVIYSMEYVQEASSDSRNDKLNDSRNDKLNDSVNNTYHIIKANPGIQRRRISELAGKSVPTIDRHISFLAKAGLIEHRDSDKTGGYYVKK